MTFCLLAHELKAQGEKNKQRFYYFFLCLMQILAEPCNASNDNCNCNVITEFITVMTYLLHYRKM